MRQAHQHSNTVDFPALVREHQAMVFGIGRNYLRNESAAEELAQEVFLELYEHLDELSSPSHITNWLRTVMSRRCIDHGRKLANRLNVSLTDAPEPAQLAAEPDPFLSGVLSRLVASLPEKQRMVVVLKYQEDMDTDEIANTLSLPTNTVKSYLHRALELLRDKCERINLRHERA